MDRRIRSRETKTRILGQKVGVFAGLKQNNPMITLPYSLVIEATEDPDFFGFYSADLDGFTGIGHLIEDCLYKSRWGMADHVQMLREQGLPLPTPNPNPTIVIQNDSKLQLA